MYWLFCNFWFMIIRKILKSNIIQLLIMFRLKEYHVNSSNYLELWKATIASHTLSFYILWFLHRHFQERGGGNGYEKKLWRRRYEYTFMICCRMYECTHDRGNEYIFYLSSDWWMILWERKKAQIKLENHKIWFVWYDNIMETHLEIPSKLEW